MRFIVCFAVNRAEKSANGGFLGGAENAQRVSGNNLLFRASGSNCDRRLASAAHGVRIVFRW